MPLVRIQIRRDTAANWTAANPVLASGEPAVETDTGKRKTGDGIRNWSSLPYDIEADLASTAPVTLGPAAAGTAKTAARADHVHPVPTSLSTGTITTSGNVTVGGNLAVTGTLTSGSTVVDAANVTGLSEAVDDRVNALLSVTGGLTKAYDDTANTLTLGIATGGSSHTHTTAQITGLDSALAGKASTVHGHELAEVTGLNAALSARPTSDPSTTLGASAITNIVALSQAAYNAITTKSATTLYVIV